jgi:hypothetical protein
MTRSGDNAARPVHPDPAELFAQFPPATDTPEYEVVSQDDLEDPYHGLLVHPYHMTVSVEAHHGDKVDVKILKVRHEGDSYSRKIVLTLRRTGKIVLFGIVRVNLALCAPAVRDEIIAGQTPFGRVLIKHKVMRVIEPTAYLRIKAGPEQLAWFGRTSEPGPIFGRIAYIHCDNQPAVELFECVMAD